MNNAIQVSGQAFSDFLFEKALPRFRSVKIKKKSLSLFWHRKTMTLKQKNIGSKT
jgi:hypothetical protein